jgi:hypothetical protein
MLFRESGAMAQRGEIQCADNQFALQSGRREKPEKLRIGGTLQRKRNTLASLCVPIQAISGPLSKHEERLSISSIRVWLLSGTRNEDMPDPCEVKA